MRMADLGRPVDVRKTLCDFGILGMRYFLFTYGSVSNNTVEELRSLKMLAVAVVIFRRLACKNRVAGSFMFVFTIIK